jgi:hypothetical protein
MRPMWAHAAWDVVKQRVCVCYKYTCRYIYTHARVMSRPPKLLDQVRTTCRRLHYSLHTERAYFRWVVRFVRFMGPYIQDYIPRYSPDESSGRAWV